MKREEIKAIFPEATKEQLDQLMGMNGADINAAKGELETVKGQLSTARGELERYRSGESNPELKAAQDKADALQKELDGLKAANGLREMRVGVAAEKKVPAELLTGETKEACEKQAEAILAFAKQGAYPDLPDGGEAAGAGTGGGKTRDQFATWFEQTTG